MSTQLKIKSIFSIFTKALRVPFLMLICLYQKTISPDHGFFKAYFPHGYCPFYPSCSEYARQTIEKNGLLPGLLLSAWRLVRCHPWTQGGIDLP